MNRHSAFTCSMAALLLVALCIGCSRPVSWLDRRDRSDPLMRRAGARQAEGDTDAAIRLYTQALHENPRLARAHLDLALLLHDHRKDYIGAVCHYRCYLDLRPPSEKRDMIESRMRRAGQLYAAKVLREDRSAAVKLDGLKQENEQLKRQVDRLRDANDKLEAAAGQARKTRIPDAVVPRTAPAPPVPAGDRDARRTYRVQRGDSLSSIAAEMYRDASQWRKIHEANRDTLGDSYDLKAGQVLVIP